MANEAPADGSNRLATSTSATCAQESRSSRLTWPGSEMRAATAFTAKEASGRCSVTSASISCCERPRAVGADGVRMAVALRRDRAVLVVQRPLTQGAVGRQGAGWAHVLLLG